MKGINIVDDPLQYAFDASHAFVKIVYLTHDVGELLFELSILGIVIGND